MENLRNQFMSEDYEIVNGEQLGTNYNDIIENVVFGGDIIVKYLKPNYYDIGQIQFDDKEWLLEYEMKNNSKLKHKSYKTFSELLKDLISIIKKYSSKRYTKLINNECLMNEILDKIGNQK